jgi:coenzyme F420-0:L-glutamate ligase / coenzyme F420-1:gamma-L-glutamate ligase
MLVARDRMPGAGNGGPGPPECVVLSDACTSHRAGVITLDALPGIPEIRPGEDLAAILGESAQQLAGGLRPTDVLAVAHKVVSKAEGRTVRLAEVFPGWEARTLADEHGKDPRHTQVILDEAQELLRADRGRFICRTRHGFVCANAGVDASNAGRPDTVVLLPEDPDASARALRHELGCAIVITDSFGRAWRKGQCEVAIGCAGLVPAQDWRGRPDADGRELAATVIAVADEAAAAADLARGKDTREPAVRIRGLEEHVTGENGPGAAALVRALEDDLFR